MTETATPRWAISTRARLSARSGRKYGVLMRFGDYWRVLLSQLILFGFTYPDKRQNVPAWVMDELMRRLSVSRPNQNSDVCYGTLLSREQYLHDVERLKYRDGRAEPIGPMSEEQIRIWSAAIPKKPTS